MNRGEETEGNLIEWIQVQISAEILSSWKFPFSRMEEIRAVTMMTTCSTCVKLYVKSFMLITLCKLKDNDKSVSNK